MPRPGRSTTLAIAGWLHDHVRSLTQVRRAAALRSRLGAALLPVSDHRTFTRGIAKPCIGSAAVPAQSCNDRPLGFV
ncbi:hypothetical protein AruPA_02775 [Acidiphilium sp. PA]|uniref:hypothetical protein n=1 Tax=Acidiphilium sp. PA TaxID=2871705 RepID=UPI00224448D0|nr:hypothetical protein [Acidiphilium sp. PA]MCW8305948.1 hypothetical protein [Acidiphilium sp. PA]